tara:strand:+ start:281 stop:919 length:639 start_codon:yes stop_codon:yes gene_type:complete
LAHFKKSTRKPRFVRGFLFVGVVFCSSIPHALKLACAHHNTQRRVQTIEIRLAKEEDAPFIALLGRTTFTETFGHFFRDPQDLIDYYNLTFSVQKIEDGIKKPDNVFWIAFANRLPVGYAKLKLNSHSDFVESQDVCQLQKIYVLKDFLSMKIGFGLQDALLKKAKELNFDEMWLSVLHSNERAIHFYKKAALNKSVITISRLEKKASSSSP